MKFMILEKRMQNCPSCGEGLGPEWRIKHRIDGFYYCRSNIVIFRESIKKPNKRKGVKNGKV